MKKVRKIISVILVAVMLAGIAAIAPVTSNAAVPAWKTAYVNYIRNHIVPDRGGYGLVDIDKNGIPELLYHTGIGSQGGAVITYYNNKLSAQHIDGYGTIYLLNNMYYVVSGRMGGYRDIVFKVNGVSSLVFDGIYVAIDQYDFDLDNPYDFIYKYRLNGTSDYTYASYEDYQAKFNSYFNENKSKQINLSNCYNYNQIISAINNYVSPPVAPTVSLTNKSNGIYVGWNKVANASKYIVYFKKPSDTAWTKYTTSNNYYTLNSVISGQLYYVQVQGIAANGTKGSYSKAKSMTFIAQPKISSLTYNGNNTLKYNYVSGANKYQIARKKSGDKGYSYFTTSSNSFKESATGGIAYTYQVRAMYATANSGTAYGAWSASKSVATLVAPTLTLSTQGKAVVAKWNSIRGAVKYTVFFKTSSAKKWNSATTSGTSLSITGVVSGTTYNVQVRPIGSTVSGPYSAVKSIKYTAPATPKPATNSYILNTHSMKFHRSDCGIGQSTSAANKSYYNGTRQQVISMGYSPCQRCNP